MESKQMSLVDLRPGIQANIVAMECGGEVDRRLQELGFVTGAEVEVLDSGHPLLVRVGDARICLRRAQARGVKVSPR
jgi:Fe2+ transport system protein FeoA